MAEKKDKSRPQLYMDDNLWQAFRLVCLRRRTSASQVVEALVRQQMTRWAEEDPRQVVLWDPTDPANA